MLLRLSADTRLITTAIVAAAVVLAVLRVGLVIALPHDRMVGLFDDDAFYYFGIARNIGAGNGSTFNGIDATNGYHPGWMILLLPVFLVADDRVALVFVTLLGAALFVGFAFLIARLAAMVEQPAAVLIATVPMLILGVAGPSYFFSGMETGLAVVALTGFALVYLGVWSRPVTSATKSEAAILGVLAAATLLARLDTVFILAIVAVVGAWHWRWRPTLVAVAAAIPAAVLGAYLVSNLVLFETLLPVSGQAKALGTGGNPAALRAYVQQPKLLGVHLYLGGIGIIVAALVAAVAHRAQARLLTVAKFGVFVFAGGILTVAYYAAASSWHLWPWYYFTIPLGILFMLPVVIDGFVPPRLITLAWPAALAGMAVVVAGSVVNEAVLTKGDKTFQVAAPDVAAQVDRLEPDSATVAIGDRAGVFGFELHRPIVHLEGLVGPKSYLDALERHTVNDFLQQRDVGLYARADAATGTPSAWHPGCRNFTEPEQGNGPKASIVVCDDDLLVSEPLKDGTEYRVWRYRANLNR